MRTKKQHYKYGTALLLDDNEIDNFINQKVIESANFAERIFTFSSGKGAMEFIQSIDHIGDNMLKNLFPEILLLDISMPMMDGFQFLKEMGKITNSYCKKCSVVILTSSLNPVDQKHSASFKNVIAFINKPLTVDKLEKLGSIKKPMRLLRDK